MAMAIGDGAWTVPQILEFAVLSATPSPFSFNIRDPQHQMRRAKVTALIFCGRWFCEIGRPGKVATAGGFTPAKLRYHLNS